MKSRNQSPRTNERSRRLCPRAMWAAGTLALILTAGCDGGITPAMLGYTPTPPANGGNVKATLDCRRPTQDGFRPRIVINGRVPAGEGKPSYAMPNSIWQTEVTVYFNDLNTRKSRSSIFWGSARFQTYPYPSAEMYKVGAGILPDDHGSFDLGDAYSRDETIRETLKLPNGRYVTAATTQLPNQLTFYCGTPQPELSKLLPTEQYQVVYAATGDWA